MTDKYSEFLPNIVPTTSKNNAPDSKAENDCVDVVSLCGACPYCSTIFQYPGALGSHLGNIHKIENIIFKCSCNKIFYCNRSFSRHKKSHS